MEDISKNPFMKDLGMIGKVSDAIDMFQAIKEAGEKGTTRSYIKAGVKIVWFALLPLHQRAGPQQLSEM
jgi:hypothetical protein